MQRLINILSGKTILYCINKSKIFFYAFFISSSNYFLVFTEVNDFKCFLSFSSLQNGIIPLRTFLLTIPLKSHILRYSDILITFLQGYLGVFLYLGSTLRIK